MTGSQDRHLPCIGPGYISHGAAVLAGQRADEDQNTCDDSLMDAVYNRGGDRNKGLGERQKWSDTFSFFTQKMSR